MLRRTLYQRHREKAVVTHGGKAGVEGSTVIGEITAAKDSKTQRAGKTVSLEQRAQRVEPHSKEKRKVPGEKCVGLHSSVSVMCQDKIIRNNHKTHLENILFSRLKKFCSGHQVDKEFTSKAGNTRTGSRSPRPESRTQDKCSTSLHVPSEKERAKPGM